LRLVRQCWRSKRLLDSESDNADLEDYVRGPASTLRRLPPIAGPRPAAYDATKNGADTKSFILK
jgi:hypothetical protein